MLSLSLNQFLVLYMWFPLAALLGLMVLIARFFERFSQERTYYRVLALPIVAFGVSGVRYASLGTATGDLVADALLGSGGLVLLIWSLRLYWLMIYRRRQ